MPKRPPKDYWAEIAKDPLKLIGLIIILISAAILYSTIFPPVPFAIVDIGPGPLIHADVPQESATRILVSVVGLILGFAMFFGRELFKGLAKRLSK